jgi:hypothetical protein
MITAMAPRPPASAPAPDRDSSASKWVLGVVAALLVTLLGGLGNYVGSSLAGVGQIGLKIDTLADRFGDLKKSVDELGEQSDQQQIAISKQDMRVSRLEQEQARLQDRMRAAEVGPRGNAPTSGQAGAP